MPQRSCPNLPAARSLLPARPPPRPVPLPRRRPPSPRLRAQGSWLAATPWRAPYACPSWASCAGSSPPRRPPWERHRSWLCAVAAAGALAPRASSLPSCRRFHPCPRTPASPRRRRYLPGSLCSVLDHRPEVALHDPVRVRLSRCRKCRVQGCVVRDAREARVAQLKELRSPPHSGTWRGERDRAGPSTPSRCGPRTAGAHCAVQLAVLKQQADWRPRPFDCVLPKTEAAHQRPYRFRRGRTPQPFVRCGLCTRPVRPLGRWRLWARSGCGARRLGWPLEGRLPCSGCPPGCERFRAGSGRSPGSESNARRLEKPAPRARRSGCPPGSRQLRRSLGPRSSRRGNRGGAVCVGGGSGGSTFTPKRAPMRRARSARRR